VTPLLSAHEGVAGIPACLPRWGIFTVTGGVTTVVDTNTVPTRFYQAVSP